MENNIKRFSTYIGSEKFIHIKNKKIVKKQNNSIPQKDWNLPENDSSSPKKKTDSPLSQTRQNSHRAENTAEDISLIF